MDFTGGDCHQQTGLDPLDNSVILRLWLYAFNYSIGHFMNAVAGSRHLQQYFSLY